MILLTGITGRSGKWFLETMTHNKAHFKHTSFRAVVRSASNAAFINDSGLPIETAYGDLENEAFLNDAMKGVNIVFHIAGIHTSLKVVKAAISNQVNWIILVHTTGIYSKYKTAAEGYLRIEEEIEKITMGADIPLTVLRPTMIYGSMDDRNVIVFIKMVDKLKLFPVVNHAKYPLQPVNAKDLGKAYYQVLTNEKTTQGKNYTLSGKDPILLIDMLKIIGKRLGKKNWFISIPFPFAYAGSYILYYLSLKRFDFRERVQRLVEPRVFSHDDASRDFNYAPMSFENGIINEIEEYIESKKQ